MTCKASEICQALGYHQLQEDDGRRNCSVQPNTLATFSMIYVLDKGLSLRLGRCSNLQDHDITTFRRQESRSEHGCSNFQQYMTLSISHASLQGKTYEQLYSATGLALQTESRLARAQELIVSLSKLGKDMQTVRVSTLMQCSDSERQLVKKLRLCLGEVQSRSRINQPGLNAPAG